MTVIRSQCKDETEYLAALRDDFAAAALQGYWAQPDEALPTGRSHNEHMALMCKGFYAWADAMLTERAK